MFSVVLSGYQWMLFPVSAVDIKKCIKLSFDSFGVIAKNSLEYLMVVNSNEWTKRHILKGLLVIMISVSSLRDSDTILALNFQTWSLIIRGAFYKFPDPFMVEAFKFVVVSWKFSMSF